MFDHVGLKVKDLEASVRFYRAALGALGHDVGSKDETSASVGALWLYADKQPKSTTHVAFRATSRKQVDRFHAAGVDAGGKDNGKPGIRGDYAPNYYAAFLVDPDGNNIEAVFLE